MPYFKEQNIIPIFGWIVSYEEGDSVNDIRRIVMRGTVPYDWSVIEFDIDTEGIVLDDGRLDEAIASHLPVLVYGIVEEDNGKKTLKAHFIKFSDDMKYLADHLGDREYGMEYDACRFNPSTMEIERVSRYARYIKDKDGEVKIVED